MRIQFANIAFQRQLTQLEKIEAKTTISEAKSALGIENFAIITHSVSLPAESSEDVGVGLLTSNQGALDYINFLYDNDINSMSIEPMGLISPPYYSPYEGSLLSRKQAVDLKELCSDKWANILSNEDFEQIVNAKNYNVQIPTATNGNNFKTVQFNKNMAIFDYAFTSMEKAMQAAFQIFREKVEQKDPRALEINAKFDNFKKSENYYLEGDSIYQILKKKYNDKPFHEWENGLHKTLFDRNDTTFSQKEKEAEISRLKREYSYEIEFYKFYQFVVNQQQKDFSDKISNLAQIRYKSDAVTILMAYQNGDITKEKYNYLKLKLDEYRQKADGVKIIGDKPVGFSDMDIFSNPSIFTKDEFMGAPPNLTKGSKGQDWDFSFIPYKNLFNPDGTLNEGGVYLKKMVKKSFQDYPGGLRIDHIIGLIDPWTYEKKNNLDEPISGSIFSLYLTSRLKEFSQAGLTVKKIIGLSDVVGAIKGTNATERAILEQRGEIDFRRANEILKDKEKFLSDIQKLNVISGSRHIFNYLLDNQLSELKQYNLTKDAIAGIIDPYNGIFNPKSLERGILVSRGVKDFDEIKKIILENKNTIDEVYSNTIEKIVLDAAREVIIENSQKNGKKLTNEEINKKVSSLIICEDLGAITLPVLGVMKKYNLIGMRNSAYANPRDVSNIHREINSAHKSNYHLISTHDTPPYKNIFESFDTETQNAHLKYLTQEMDLGDENIDLKDTSEILQLKVARILAGDKNPKTPNNIMLSWLDVFGANKPYNHPGVQNKEKNWNLRISSPYENFEKTYYEKTLPQNQGVNLFQALAVAMKACKVDKTNPQTIDDLERLAQIARE